MAETFDEKLKRWQHEGHSTIDKGPNAPAVSTTTNASAPLTASNAPVSNISTAEQLRDLDVIRLSQPDTKITQLTTKQKPYFITLDDENLPTIDPLTEQKRLNKARARNITAIIEFDKAHPRGQVQEPMEQGSLAQNVKADEQYEIPSVGQEVDQPQEDNSAGSSGKSPDAGSIDQSGSAVIARELAPQLGSSPQILMQGQIDERKLAVLNELTQTALGYFSYRGRIDDVRFFRWISRWELITSQSVNGLARRHILQAIAAANGAQVSEPVQKPGIIARNLWKRSWKDDAIHSGKEPME